MGVTTEWLAVAILGPAVTFLEASGMPQNRLRPVGWIGAQVSIHSCSPASVWVSVPVGFKSENSNWLNLREGRADHRGGTNPGPCPLAGGGGSRVSDT